VVFCFPTVSVLPLFTRSFDMPRWSLFALDIVAIVVLSFAVYFPRYRRHDLVVAFVAVNIGVMAVAVTLTSTVVGAGLGFGLFGVLSIVRLRSAELGQQEIAYFLAALTLGLLGGIQLTPDWVSPALMAALLVALFLGDHPALFASYRQQVMTLDRAWTDEAAVVAYLDELLDARVRHLTVRRVDLVNETTIVDVRYRLNATGRSAARVAR
jgi:hypothetical protein